jgi:hypothetical protein
MNLRVWPELELVFLPRTVLNDLKPLWLEIH